MPALPSGTVTFLFTDIERSTRILQYLGDRYSDVLGDYRRVLRERFGEAHGSEIDVQGDALFYSFARAKDAAAGAVAAQRALAAHEWPEGVDLRARMGLHTGEPTVGDEGYVGLDVVRAARICSAAHGGQILLSETTRVLLGNDLPEGARVHDLGQQALKDIQHERIFQLALDDGPVDFPPLKTEAPGETRVERIADSFGARIAAYVEQTIEQSLRESLPTMPAGPASASPGARGGRFGRIAATLRPGRLFDRRSRL